MKSLAPHVEIVGVEASAYPSAQRSLASGRIEACGDTSTLADGIAVRRIGDLPFALMQRVRRANVLEVHHERAFAAGPVRTTAVRFTLETRGRDHVQQVMERLECEDFSAREERREL